MVITSTACAPRWVCWTLTVIPAPSATELCP